MLDVYKPGGEYGEQYASCLKRAKLEHCQIHKISYSELRVYFGKVPVSCIKISVDRGMIHVQGQIGEFAFSCDNSDKNKAYDLTTYYLDYDSQKEFTINYDLEDFEGNEVVYIADRATG